MRLSSYGIFTSLKEEKIQFYYTPKEFGHSINNAKAGFYCANQTKRNEKHELNSKIINIIIPETCESMG